MTQPPMKVSEAVFELRDEVETGTMSPVRRKQLETLLASHEALRLAGEEILKNPFCHSEVQKFGTVVMAEKDYLALSLAVEDASK